MTMLSTPSYRPRATGRAYTSVWLHNTGRWYWHVVNAEGERLRWGHEMTEDLAKTEARAVYDSLNTHGDVA